MIDFLPENIPLLREAFDVACGQILKSTENRSFYALFTNLASMLRKHTLLKDWLTELEIKSLKRKEQFEAEALDAVEDNWLKLWKYHKHNLKHRKKLVEIKGLVTSPKEIGSSPLYSRILSRMWEFRHFSPFCRFISESWRFFKHAQYELIQGIAQFDHFYQLGNRCFFQKYTISVESKNEYPHFREKIFTFKPINNIHIRRSAEPISSAFFCLKTEEVTRKFSIAGQNNLETRNNMQIQAKINPVFCWERIRFLQECAAQTKYSPSTSRVGGKWGQIREIAWKTAINRCETETIFSAKRAFIKKLCQKEVGDSSVLDTFVVPEYQIYRRDYEIYLEALKSHIQTQLFKIQDAQEKAKESPLADLPGTQKKDFVIDLAHKFWKANPFGTHDDAFAYYNVNCPFDKILSRSRWDQIIRKCKLDPRPKTAKKRGPGKKTCKK